MDYYEKEPVSLYLSELTLIEKYNSDKQTISLFNHPWLGRILVINDEIQHIENYQVIYHEMLVHLPISFIPEIKNVLILGGGSLFAAEEVLKYSSVTQLTLCDYDPSVLEIMKKYYSHANRVYNDKRFHYVNNDVSNFIMTCDVKFDLIINDCFNISNQSNNDDVSYYHIMSELCSSTGLCVDIIYRHIFDKQTTRDALLYLKKENNVVLSMVSVPEYPGILHLETIWGNSSFLSQSAQKVVNRIQNSSPSFFTYYNPKYLEYYLYLPPYIQNKFTL